MENRNQQVVCHICELIARRDSGEAPLWDAILRTNNFDVVHSYNTALPGWLVLVVRRHIATITEMTEVEATEMGTLIRNVSLALQKVTGCAKTYVVQFAEMAEHSHVHFHIIPRMADLPEKYKGTGIFDFVGVSPKERISEELMNDIALRVRKDLVDRGDRA